MASSSRAGIPIASISGFVPTTSVAADPKFTLRFFLNHQKPNVRPASKVNGTMTAIAAMAPVDKFFDPVSLLVSVGVVTVLVFVAKSESFQRIWIGYAYSSGAPALV